MRYAFLIIIIFFNLLFISKVSAIVYKWEDDNHEIHYSQTPPDNVNATKIAPPPPPSSTATTEKKRYQDLQNQLKQSEEKQIADKEKTKRDAEDERLRAANCERAKTHLNNMLSKIRVRMPDTSGNQVVLTPQERDEDIQKTKENVDSYCSPATPTQTSTTPTIPTTK